MEFLRVRQFLRGSIVSYPVICTPSHSCASVSLSSSTYQSRSHVFAACSTRRPQVHHLTHEIECCDDGYIFGRGKIAGISISIPPTTRVRAISYGC